VLGAGLFAACETPFLSVGGTTLCYDPIAVYLVMFQGAFGSMFNLSLTLSETTLLAFTGASVAIAFRGGLFNIGSQGQLVLGALAVALGLLWLAPVVAPLPLGGPLLVVSGLVIGGVVGGAYGAVPGALKAYADANEVITTIMLNFIASAIAFVLVSLYFKDPGTANVQTRALPDAALLAPVAFPETADFSLLALLLAVATVVGLYWMLTRTAFGYDVRTIGVQPAAADYAGVSEARVTVRTMTLSGALGGIGGAVYVMMVLGQWRAGIPAIGFDGIAVSILAGNSPVGVVPAAFLFGVLKSGGLAVDLNLGVPNQLIGVLRGLIILFVAMPEFFRMLGKRRLPAGGGSDGGPGGDEPGTETGTETHGEGTDAA